MAVLSSSVARRGRYKYGRLPQHAQRDDREPGSAVKSASKKRRLLITVVAVVASFALLWAFIRSFGGDPSRHESCDSVDGYHCRPALSYFWGQYSPYFSVPSDIKADTPSGCTITFAQILSRHGGRDPTSTKGELYSSTIGRIKSDVDTFQGNYSFLKDYDYTLGSEQLTGFGQQQMVYSGQKFYNRYAPLAQKHSPFLRASGQRRVVESAEKFAQGFHLAKTADGGSLLGMDPYPYDILVIPERIGMNNSLSHELCDAFENQPLDNVKKLAEAKWMDIFVPPIQERLNRDLPGAKLSQHETVYMMDLCPFQTIASPTGQVSSFCGLFTETEWHQYDYLQSLGKYYGYGNGHPLGPTQGVGFTNELIARLTNAPVDDHTSTNHTLDSGNATFPLGGEHVLFADFSHDNDMIAIYSAMGLYNATAPLSNVSMQTTKQTNGYAASWAVPFAARAYFEKMKCSGQSEELVRVLINDRVIPLHTCGADSLGRCTLSAFVDSLEFARGGGHWDRCFQAEP